MYDDIINSVAYSIVFDGNFFIDSVMNYCNANSLPFFSVLGVYIGVKFLKDSFSI